jgi:ketosteroid isomerase-like protein
MMMTLAVMFTILTSLGSPQSQDVVAVVSRDPGVAKQDGLDDVYERFATAYTRLDADAVAGQYAPDVLYLSPTADLLRGRAAVQQYFEKFFGSVRESGDSLSITFRVVARREAGEVAWDVGYYDLRRRSGAKFTTSRGKYAVVAERDRSGTWHFKVDSYSSVPKDAR